MNLCIPTVLHSGVIGHICTSFRNENIAVEDWCISSYVMHIQEYCIDRFAGVLGLSLHTVLYESWPGTPIRRTWLVGTVIEKLCKTRFLLYFCISGSLLVECTETLYYDSPEIQKFSRNRGSCCRKWENEPGHSKVVLAGFLWRSTNGGQRISDCVKYYCSTAVG